MIDIKKSKHDIILNTTTFCNYNCSYCDVVKDKKNLDYQTLNNLIIFLKNNSDKINKIKFFWWEPLLVFENIKCIIKNSKDLIGNNYEIVTNTSILNDEIWEYFNKYFKTIFFSIDSENKFNYEKVYEFIEKFELHEKIYFNLVINPWTEDFSYFQYEKIYKYWYKKFNILPVYYTKKWTKENLQNLSYIMKKILDSSIIEKDIKLYWFQDNSWYNKSLINNSIFIDYDWKIYLSDIICTNIWKTLKNDLYLWSIDNYNMNDTLSLSLKQNILNNFEKQISKNIWWQGKLHKIMDYFSKYLNTQKWIIKD